MTADIENLILEHLRAIRDDIGKLKKDSTEVKMRLIAIEGHFAASAVTEARLSSEIEEHNKRLERIEQRLQIASQ